MKLKQLCFQFAKEKKYSMQRKCLKVTCPATCPVQFCCREALTLFWERQMPVFFAALHGFIHQPPHLYRTQQQHGDLQKEPQMPKHPTHQKVCRMLKSQHASFALFAKSASLYFLKFSKLNWLVVEKKMYKVQESLRKDLTSETRHVEVPTIFFAFLFNPTDPWYRMAARSYEIRNQLSNHQFNTLSLSD